ncbi:MAG: hypothetical protein OXB95_06405 [Rhodobacteraceae bacterium]|nr:hypothetical protein [Paracoccaceae bacterium]
MIRRGLANAAQFSAVAVLSILATVVDIQPATPLSGSFNFPNLVYCLICAWIIRSPRNAPALVVAALFLLLEVIYGLPPGLWTALMLVATELLRSVSPRLGSYSFVAEWAFVCLLFSLALLLYQLALLLTFAQAMTTVAMTKYIVSTALCYPLAAAIASLVVRRGRASDPSPG